MIYIFKALKEKLNSNNNLLNLDKIQSFKNKIISLNYDDFNEYLKNIPNEDTKIIQDIILHYNYPKPLKDSALKLYRYLKPRNLVFCALNLLDVNLTKKALYSKDSQGYTIRVNAAYSFKKNMIIYKDKIDIYHEFIHMSSNSPLKNRIGFYTCDNGIHTTGLNEGYTELLSRRIFFNKNYDTDSYKFYVDFMLLFEQLYDSYHDMESDYFSGNYDNLKSSFLNYGTLEEYYQIINTLNIECWLLTDNDKCQTFKLMRNILSRKNSITNKTNLAYSKS